KGVMCAKKQEEIEIAQFNLPYKLIKPNNSTFERQRVLHEHLRPSSSHSFEGSLSLLLRAWLGTVLRTRGPLSMEMMLSLSRHIGLHFASPNVATSRILFLMITLQVQMVAPSSDQESLNRTGKSCRLRTHMRKKAHEKKKRPMSSASSSSDCCSSSMTTAATQKRTDKASLLAEVIQHVKELKRETSVVSETNLVPTESKELTVAFTEKEDIGDGRFVIKASVCCKDRSDLLPDMIKTLKAMRLKTLKAEITTVGGRVKNVLFVTGKECSGEEEMEEYCIETIEEVLKAVMERSNVEEASSSGNAKRQRMSSQNTITIR
ncbi:hypothetical protein HID58_046935, partial [Brassica napus]